jgi:hypothetical protein
VRASREVWKFQVAPSHAPVAVDMPGGAAIVHFAEQAGLLYLWALVDPDAPMVPHDVWVIGTGWGADLSAWEHVASCLSAGGAFVWHLFARATGGER